jgi:hypothetical protein
MAVKSKTVITESIVDELAQVRDQLKALTAREKYLKELFREAGEAIYKGRHHQLEIRFSTEQRLDTGAARVALGEDWCAAHMNTIEKMNIKQMEIIK